MPISQSNLAMRFAQRISKEFKRPRFRRGLLKVVTKDKDFEPIGQEIGMCLDEFLEAEGAGSAQLSRLVNWEGNKQKRRGKRLYYRVVGPRSYPDAGVLRPFTCAFEFDCEVKPNRADFKDALMKASVHVLSRRYQACVFVYILRRTPERRKYLDPKSLYTQELVGKLQAAGLYVALVKEPR